MAKGKGSPSFEFKQEGEKLTGTYSGKFGKAALTGTVSGAANMKGAEKHSERRSATSVRRRYSCGRPRGKPSCSHSALPTVRFWARKSFWYFRIME